MKKLKNTIYFVILSILSISYVNAKEFNHTEIPENAIVVGTHLFSSNYSGSDFYSGTFDFVAALYGASSFNTSSIKTTSDIVVYYKLFNADEEDPETFPEEWINSIDGAEIDNADIPEKFDITHINGVCVDPVCGENPMEVVFKSTNPADDFGDNKTLITYGDKISAGSVPEVKVRPGYVFKGWVKEDGTKFDLNDEVVEDMVLSTDWEAIEYNVTFESDYEGGQAVEKTCYYDVAGNACSFIDYTIAVKPNYHFVGWSTVSGDTTSNRVVYAVDSDMASVLGTNANVTLYAVWAPNEYIISYDLNGGTFTDANVETKYTMEDGKLTLPTGLSKTGYTFKQWNYNDEKYNNQLVANGMTLVAEWIANTYEFKYSDTQRVTCVYDSECTIDFTPSNIPEGKEFDKWFIEEDGNKVYVDSNVKLNNFTAENGKVFNLKPEYTLIPYNISYNYNDGSVNKDNVTIFTYDSENVVNNKKITLNVPTKDGYTFNGWSVTAGNAIVSGNTLTINGIGNVELTALFSENKYTIIYKNNGSVYKTQENILYTNLRTIDEKLVDSVNDFDGWITNNGLVFGSDAVLVAVDTYANENVITLNAKWTNKDKYSVSYDLDGGLFASDDNAKAQSSYLRGESVTLPLVSKNGYEFTGWTLNGENVGKITEVTGRNENLDLKANWKNNKYTIEFYKNDDTKINSVECEYDKECNLGKHNNIDLFEDENVELTGWATEIGGQIFYGDNINVKNLTATNGEVIKLYTVSEDRNIYYNVTSDLGVGVLEEGQLPIQDGIVKKDTEITLPIFVENAEYIFDGWYVNNVKVENDIITITGNSHIEARWTKKVINEFNTYSVTFVRNENVLGKVNINTYDNFISINEEGYIVANYNYVSAYQVAGFEYQVADDYVMEHNNTNLSVRRYRYTLYDNDELVSVILVNTYDELILVDDDNNNILNENYNVIEQATGFKFVIEEISEDGNNVKRTLTVEKDTTNLGEV